MGKMKKRLDLEDKKGQVTIFIILGIVIVVLGALIYMFYPQIQASFGFEVVSPYEFMRTCLEEDVTSAATAVALHGGSIEPEFNYTYQGESMEYLCYINEPYKQCIVQQPFLIQHIEDEIESEISQQVNYCFDELKSSYESRGYNVVLRKSDFRVDLLPKRITINSNTTMSLKKDETQTFQSFNIGFENNLYELASIARNIVEWETSLGDAETTVYMDYYHDLKVEKKKQSDGTTVYIITDKNSGNKFQFASRSVVWPAGYGVK